jgi:hypothetical protein
MFPPAFDLVTQRRVEPFCCDRRFQFQVVEVVFTRNSFDFRNDSRPDPTSGSTRGHVARPQFGAADHDGTNADDFTIHFSYQSYFPVTVGEESFDYLVSDWSRPCLYDGRRVVFGCDTSNRSVMDFQEAACVLGSHLTNGDGHGRQAQRGRSLYQSSWISSGRSE